ncbi:MAG: MG2 domain-containing protein, partial [Candidatus Entotheonellia bacterium]
MGIPLEAPGLYMVELESARLGASLLDKPQPMYVPAAALVTNLSVHFKWGRETSLIWVTTLDAGRPVPDAQVAVHNCRGIVLWRGQTDRQGIARLGRLPSQDTLPSCPFDYPERFYSYDWTPALRDLSEGLFVTAQVENDLSFVHSSWGQGIEGWRFQLSSGRYGGHVVAHTIFDRPLFRAGEMVHMKHLLREQVLPGFALVPAAQRPTHAVIQHQGSDETYELSLYWDAAGSAENTWRIPKEAKLGLYLVLLQRPSPRRGAPESFEPHIFSGQFRVEEFRVPLLRGSLRLPPEPQIAVSEVPVDMSVQYLAGGGAGNLPVTLRTQLRP